MKHILKELSYFLLIAFLSLIATSILCFTFYFYAPSKVFTDSPKHTTNFIHTTSGLPNHEWEYLLITFVDE